MNDTHYAITVFITLLLISSAVAMAAKWVKVPYTLMLVIVGLIITPMHFLPVLHMSPELILLIFLPALLFDAAWNLKLDHLRENLLPILTLAVVGVCLSVGVIGLILHFLGGVSWEGSLLFGAMISATDPVSVLAIFKKLKLPNRLVTVLEGESLFNDGTAVVVFRIVLAVVAGTASNTTGGLIFGSLRDFILVVLGGVMIGAIIGIVASHLTSYFDDHLLEITLTTIAAYGSFLLAEGIHVSPVIAVLITGLIIGNFGRRTGMSPSTQVAVNSFWEYAAFVVNSLVFLLIGMEMELPKLLENIEQICWAILAILTARAIAIYGLMPVINAFTKPIPIRWQHVLFWGGLRGSLSIALALSLPATFAGRSQLVIMVFGVVMFSLLVQGLTVSPLLRWLGFTQPEARLRDYELVHGQLLGDTAALTELDELQARGLITERVYQVLRDEVAEDHQKLQSRAAELGEVEEVVEQQQIRRLRRHLTDVRKARFRELLREGILTSAVHQELEQEVDRRFPETYEDGAGPA
jgi:CPA1 family monovalent cation:H+ antiporter